MMMIHYVKKFFTLHLFGYNDCFIECFDKLEFCLSGILSMKYLFAGFFDPID